MPDLGENELRNIRQAMREWSLDDAVSFGLVPGIRNRNVFGIKKNVQTGGPFDLTPLDSVYVFPSDSGEAMELVADAADSGVISAFILDEDQGGIEVRVDLVFAGATPVAIPGNPSRVIEAFVSGSDPITGTAVIRRVGGDQQAFAQVQVLSQRSDQCIYTIPRNVTAIIKNFVPTIQKSGGANSAVVVLVSTRLEGSVFTIPAALGMTSEGDTSPEFDNATATEIPPFTDIKISVNEASLAGSDIAARMGLRLKEIQI